MAFAMVIFEISIQVVPKESNSSLAPGDMSSFSIVAAFVKMTPVKNSSRKTSSVER